MKRSTIVAVFTALCVTPIHAQAEDKSQPDYVSVARALTERLLPKRAEQFVFEQIPSDNGQDVFELESRNGKILVRGNNGVSMASGLNWYLRHVCNCQITWRSRRLDLPQQLPQVTENGQPVKIRKTSPHKYRYYFNYCCFSYALAYWDWSDWQRMIDLMALNGINAPLSVTGQEAVWLNTGRRLGLSDEQMQKFFVGPGYLPFGWMGCIDGWAGPLPNSWIERHAKLQKKIIAQERSFGMTPILQGFTGHAPVGLKEVYPQAKIVKLTPWCAFPSTYFVDPNDPLFQKVGKTFIEEQTKLFGTNHLYASDTFIEMQPTSNDPKFLAAMAKAIHGSMTAADPEAVWVLQGWIFYHCRNFWKPPQYRAFLGAVPQDKLLVLDLMCEGFPTWPRTEAFCGHPWVWCIIQNFGGTVSLHGGLEQMFTDLSKALAQRGGKAGKLSGIGYIMEGLGWNPVFEAFQADMAWCNKVPKLETWLDGFVRQRYGGDCPAARKAWQALRQSVYKTNRRIDPLVVKRPALDARSATVDWRVVPAWEKLLQCSDKLGHLDTYRFDLTNVSREILSRLSSKYGAEMSLAYRAKDRAALKVASDRMQDLIDDLDRMLAAHPQYLLGPWLERAKRWGLNDQERKHYEWNARTIISLWGPPNGILDDYSNRQWAGMMKDYYARRWQLFYKALDRALEENKDFDSAAFKRFMLDWQADWARETKTFATEASGEDPVAISKDMFAKYKDQIVFTPEIKSLTLGKPVSCSDAIERYPANKANDGIVADPNSYWACDVGKREGPAWWQVDFEKPTKIGRVVVVGFYGDTRHYGFTVEGSLDGKKWKILADHRKNIEISMPQGYRCKFPPQTVQYLRVTQTFNSANSGRHLVEVMAFEK